MSGYQYTFAYKVLIFRLCVLLGILFVTILHASTGLWNARWLPKDYSRLVASCDMLYLSVHLLSHLVPI